jgi:hypothetical protein
MLWSIAQTAAVFALPQHISRAATRRRYYD